MKIDAIRLDTHGVQTQPVSPVVEAVAIDGKPADLFRGQRLTATVVEANGQQVLLNLQGTQVALPASVDLKPGTEILLRVASVAPKLLLEIAPDSTRVQAQLPPLVLGQT